MFLRIDPSSGVPIYRQIVAQVRRSIASGALAPGDRLPSVRGLAGEMKVNPTTIVKAYSELEHDGLVETRHGMGTFVSAERVDRRVEARSIVEQAAERLVVEARQLGVADEEVARIVQDTLNRVPKGGRDGS